MLCQGKKQGIPAQCIFRGTAAIFNIEKTISSVLYNHKTASPSSLQECRCSNLGRFRIQASGFRGQAGSGYLGRSGKGSGAEG